MQTELRQLNVIHRIFNVRPKEWSKILFAWFLRYIYRFSFVLGWTILVAMFVTAYGIYYLPYLLVLNAGSSILGSILCAIFFGKTDKRKLMIATVFLAAVFLFVANSVFLGSQKIFFSLIILTVGLFLTQLKTMIDAYLEEFFTSFEGERVFTLIESADTVGGICAGLILFLFVSVFPINSFIYLWIGIMVLMVPLLLWQSDFGEQMHLGKEKHDQPSSSGIVSDLKSIFKKSNLGSYVLGLSLIIFFQWFLFNLLEFQFTKAVYENTSSVIFEAGSGFEHAFIHDLGILFIIFSTSSLIVQFFLGSRLINNLGIVGSLLLHPIVTLLSLLGLTGFFNYNMAVLAKNNFTMTTVIHTNAYHVSFYVLNEETREKVRAFLEGIARPVGALVGTFLLIIMQDFFSGEELIFFVNLLMVFATALFFYVTYCQKNKYTKIAIGDLLNSEDYSLRKSALDVLSQRGHKLALPILKQVIFDPKESISLRIRALKALGVSNDKETILDIIKCFEDRNPYMREAALDILLANRRLVASDKEDLYFKYSLIDALKKTYESEENEEIMKKIVYIMSSLSNVSTVDFLLKLLDEKDSLHRVEAIYSLGKYRDENIAMILKNFLDSEVVAEQINAAIALWNFDCFRDDSTYHILSFLYSRDTAKIACGLYAVGEIGLKTQKYLCFKYLNDKDLNLKMYAALALARFGHGAAVPVLVNLLLSGDETTVKSLKYLMNNVDLKICRSIDRILKQLVVEEINSLKKEYGELTLEKLPTDLLKRLKHLYSLIDEYEEMDKISCHLSII